MSKSPGKAASEGGRRRAGWVAAAWGVLLWAAIAPQAAACDPDAVAWVGLFPDKVDVPLGGEATVSALIHCYTNGGDFTGEHTVGFEVRLVDEDGGPGQVDVLDRRTAVVQVPPEQGFRAGLTLVFDFTVRCPADGLGLVGLEDAGEGALSSGDAAELVLQIDHGRTVRSALYFPHNLDGNPAAGRAVSARCIDETLSSTGGADPTRALDAALRRSGAAFKHAGLALDGFAPAGDNLLTGPYALEAWLKSAPAAQGPLLKLPDTLSVEVTQVDVVIGGTGDWVAVRGRLQEDGSLRASGAGGVAGLPPVQATFDGRLLHGELHGTYTLGAAGGLPGGKPLVYQLEGRGARWSAFWQPVADAFQQAAAHTATVNFSTAALGVELEPQMTAWTAALLDAQAAAGFGPADGLGDALREMGDALDAIAAKVSRGKLDEGPEVLVALNAAAGHLAEAAAAYADVLAASILPRPVARISIESVLDANANNLIDDDEILNAVRLWIRGHQVPGTLQSIDDGDILVLVELWVLGRLIGNTFAASAGSFLSNVIQAFLDPLAAAGPRLVEAGELLLAQAQRRQGMAPQAEAFGPPAPVAPERRV